MLSLFIRVQSCGWSLLYDVQCTYVTGTLLIMGSNLISFLGLPLVWLVVWWLMWLVVWLAVSSESVSVRQLLSERRLV